MIKKIQQDFIYFLHEFKDNYRKGVHRLRTILASRAQAQAFVSNAGGVAVVLGYEPSAPDKNAQELYALLAASPYIDDAVQTFLGSIYEAGAESQDAMYSDSARCLEILHDPVMARAAGAGAVSAGKWIATLAGQSCNLYRDMNAVAASDIAMTAVAASETAMEAVISSTIALNAVAASKTAMTAVAANETAMVAVAASRVAMSAIIGNSTALNAVVTSSVAMAAVIGNSTALNAVVSSSTAMAAVAASSTAMTAIANNKTAITAVEASVVAKNALYNSPLKTSISNIASTSSWTTRRNGKIWLISFRQTWSSGNTSMQHRSTLKDGGTVSCTASQSYNTDYRIDRFMDSITNYNSAGGIGNVCTYYFIPC